MATTLDSKHCNDGLLREKFGREQVATVFSNSVLATSVSLGLAFVLAWLFQDYSPHHRIAGWLGLNIFGIALHYITYFYYHRRADAF